MANKKKKKKRKVSDITFQGKVERKKSYVWLQLTRHLKTGSGEKA